MAVDASFTDVAEREETTGRIFKKEIKRREIEIQQNVAYKACANHKFTKSCTDIG